MAVKKPKTEEPDAVVSAGFSAYIGPSIPGCIQTGTIYPVGQADALELPEVQMALNTCPGIAAFVVDGATLPEDRIRIKTPGDPLYEAYRDFRR